MQNAPNQTHPPIPPVRLLVAGAGTGGHLFPGIAVAQTILSRSPESRILFVTTGRPIETTVLDRQAFETAAIPAAGIKGKSLMDKFRSITLLPRGFFASLKILRHFRPDAVMGMGGYSSGPVIAGAWMLGIPSVVHEQNRLPGMTNRLLSRFVSRIYVSFADTQIEGREEKIRFTGNPVRGDIMSCAKAREKEAGGDRPLTIAILGGSQGAHSINMAVIDAIDHLAHPEKFHFIHQTGSADVDLVRETYSEKGVSAEVSAFFDDMADLYRRCDLAVCRAGASTVAELAAACVPAVFIPFPHAADNHQVANAEAMVNAGAAQMLPEPEMTGEEIAARLESFENDRSILQAMTAAIPGAMGAPDAAGAIADDLLRLIGV